MPEYVTKAEFARRAKVSRQYIGKIVKSGLLPVNEAGMLDFEESMILFQNSRAQSDRNLEQWTEEQRGRGPKKAAAARAGADSSAQKLSTTQGPANNTDNKNISWGSQYQKARAAAQAIKARREDLELKQLEGSLIEVSSVKNQIEQIANVIRTRLNKFPSKYAGRLQGLTSVEIQEELEAGIYEILSEFQDYNEALKEDLAHGDRK